MFQFVLALWHFSNVSTELKEMRSHAQALVRRTSYAVQRVKTLHDDIECATIECTSRMIELGKELEHAGYLGDNGQGTGELVEAGNLPAGGALVLGCALRPRGAAGDDAPKAVSSCEGGHLVVGDVPAQSGGGPEVGTDVAVHPGLDSGVVLPTSEVIPLRFDSGPNGFCDCGAAGYLLLDA